MSDERRSDERLPVIWEGVLSTEDGEEHPCQVRDISLAGTLISTDADFDDGAQLILSIEGLGEYAGVVRWQGDSSVGLALLAGPDLTLKRFAEKAGSEISKKPVAAED